MLKENPEWEKRSIFVNPASQLGLWCANSILGRKTTNQHNFSLKSRMRLKTYTFTKSDFLFPMIVLSFRSDFKLFFNKKNQK